MTKDYNRRVKHPPYYNRSPPLVFHQGENIMQSFFLLEVVLNMRWSLIKVVSPEGDYRIIKESMQKENDYKVL